MELGVLMNNMKKLTFSLFAIAILFVGYTYFEYGSDIYFLGGGRVAPDYLYPVTGGSSDTSDYTELTIEYSGKSYSEANRKVTQAVKKKVCYIYECKGSYQVDHIVSLGLGGSNEITNLWAMPETNMWNGENWGYKRKDAVEKILIERMKGKKMTPLEAQKCLSEDWIRCWKKYAKPMIGGLGEAEDNEDEIINDL